MCSSDLRMILGISLLGDRDILSVLVCFASVCIIIRILRQCFIVVRFYPYHRGLLLLHMFLVSAHLSIMNLWLYSSGRRYLRLSAPVMPT